MTSPSSPPQRVRALGFILALLVALVGAWLFAPAALAAEITVNATCTITDAITSANLDSSVGGCDPGSGADTVILAANGAYTLTTVDNSEGGNPDGDHLPIIEHRP